MKYIYAALLLHEAGKEINEENLKKVIEATGTDIDEARIKALATALKNVNVEEIINSALAAPTAIPPSTPTPAEAPKEPVKEEEEKKEEKEEKKEEEEALEGLGALFG